MIPDMSKAEMVIVGIAIVGFIFAAIFLMSHPIIGFAK